MGAFLFWGRYLYIITHIKYLKKKIKKLYYDNTDRQWTR